MAKVTLTSAMRNVRKKAGQHAIDEILDGVYSAVNPTTKVEQPRQLEALAPIGPVPTGIEPAKALPIDIGFEDDEDAILVILLGD